MDLWLFGYGSLIWRPSFPFAERQPALVRGWARRFCQASWDHRGTPEAPGRVPTLITEPGAECRGVAYRLEANDQILAELDHREKAGYSRHRERAFLDDGRRLDDVLIYIGSQESEDFVAGESIEQIAAIIRTAHGPSGSNRDYLAELIAALGELGCRDPHVEALWALVRGDESP